MKDSPPPTKCWRYDDTFRAEALCLAGESRSTQAAAAESLHLRALAQRQAQELNNLKRAIATAC